MKPAILKTKDASLAYHHTKGKLPGIMFLGGFRSDMTGTKAMALDAFCKTQRRSFTRFDYSGHGQSSGKFEEGTIGAWKRDALALLDEVAEGPQVLVGSSMGGWLMLLVAMERPERVKALVGVAAAPDFTQTLITQHFTKKQKKEMLTQGKVMLPDCNGGTPYAITKELLLESRAHMVLNGPIPITCPVRLMHGMKDEDVPWEFSLSLNEKLESKDVRVKLITNGTHRLSEPENLATLCKIVESLI